MKKKSVGIFVCMLLIAAAVLPVAGTENFNTTKLEKHFLGATEQGSTTSVGDWWPMHRHDPGNTGCSSSIAPNTNRVCWEQNIGEEIYTAAPIVVDDRLYISTESFYKDIGPLFMSNGTKLSIPEKPPDLSEILEVIMTQKEDYFGGVYCLDADDGTLLWNYSMYSPNDPAVVDGKVYVTDFDFYTYYFSSSLYCLDAVTGNKIWQKPLDYAILTPTIVADDKIYLGALDFYSFTGTFLCLDLNGDVIWTHPMQYSELMLFTSPAVCEGKVCFLTWDLYSYFTGNLYCLNAETGVNLWTKTIFNYPYFFGSRSPVCSDGKVYISDMDIYSYNGQLYCYDLATGQPEWTYYNLGWSFSTPVVCDGSVYITALDFSYYEMSIYCIDAESGVLIWRAPAPGEVYYFFFAGSLICADDKLYLAPFSFYYYGQNTLYCLDADDGSQLWDYTLNDETVCSPSIADERMYIADVYGNIYAFEDELKLKRLAGGFLNVKAFIANDGDASLSNVTWYITVVGGMFGNVTRSGTIPTLNPGILGIKIKRAFPVFGFGSIQVTATVTMPDLNVIKRTKEGFVLGPIVVLLPFLG